MSYRIRLINFEGPLDLLLFLIRKNEVNIYDIPIAEITRQYLEYLEIIKFLDLEAAGDFLVLAATLIRIKVQMLLPKPLTEDDEEEILDPRLELVTRLLEYKRFKEVASKLQDLESTQSNIFQRNFYDPDDAATETEAEYTGDVSLFALICAFKQTIENIPVEPVHEVKTIKVSTEEQIEYILSILNQKMQISFVDLISHLTNKLIMIVTFMALLDLIKQGSVIVKQSAPFGEIWITKK